MVKEITGLQLENIDLEKAEIYIEKGGKTNARKLPLKANQIILFQKYLEERNQILALNKQTETNKYFIISKFGNALNPHGICRLINEDKPKQEIEERDSPNPNLKIKTKRQRIQPLKIRQSVIANLLKSGNDVRVVQIFIGHRRSSSTEEYKQTELEVLQNAVNQFHPRR